MRRLLNRRQPLGHDLIPRSHVELVAAAQGAPSFSTKQGAPFSVPLPLDRMHSFRQGLRCVDDLGVPVGSGLALLNLPSC